MLGRLNATQLELVRRKVFSCGVDEVLPYVQFKNRTSDLTPLERFQKGCP
jgi:hypothetical protein